MTADASAVPLEREAFDAALCLGATFVWGTIRDAAAAVRPAVRCDGFVAIGEPYWRQWPLPDQIDADGFVGLSDTVGRFEGARFAVTGIVGSSEDDWDRYESLHWRAIEEWLTDHPDGAGAAEVRAQHERFRGDYIGFKRALLGWAIFVGRKR